MYHAFAADEMPCEQELDYLSHALFETDQTPAGNPRNSVSVADGGMSTCSDVSQLEDEIDILADAFIRRFRTQMYLQKQDSFERYRAMLNRSV